MVIENHYNGAFVSCILDLVLSGM